MKKSKPLMYNWNSTIDFLSALNGNYVKQDTIKTQADSLELTTIQKRDTTIEDTTHKGLKNQNTIQPINFSAIDSIFRKNEERERLIEEQKQQIIAAKKWYRREVDTTEILYKEFGIAGFPLKEKLNRDQFSQNVLYNIVVVKPEEKQVHQDVFIEDQKTVFSQQKAKSTINQNVKQIQPKFIEGKLQFDWITILLIGSFFLLGWIRLFSKKYLGTLVKSIISYKESSSLFREKNSLMERASFMLNILYLSNVSVFVIQLKHYWDIEINGFEDWKIYFIVFASLIGLYLFRALSSSFIGYTFLKRRIFSEYFHNVNIFTKNTGLFLFPVIVTLQFLTYQYLNMIVYTGLAIVAALYLLLLVRAFQIIIRKNVSIYYMILYLCAFEFAPFLIIYKILLSHS